MEPRRTSIFSADQNSRPTRGLRLQGNDDVDVVDDDDEEKQISLDALQHFLTHSFVPRACIFYLFTFQLLLLGWLLCFSLSGLLPSNSIAISGWFATSSRLLCHCVNHCCHCCCNQNPLLIRAIAFSPLLDVVDSLAAAKPTKLRTYCCLTENTRRLWTVALDWFGFIKRNFDCLSAHFVFVEKKIIMNQT